MRYVLLRHECPADYREGPHWDLMLEDAEGLLTWSLLELPEAWKEVGRPSSAPYGAELGRPTINESKVAATRLPNHRIAYLDYEGEVSGNRGRVKRIASGEFNWRQRGKDGCEVEATTGALRGEWYFERIAGDEWRLHV